MKRHASRLAVVGGAEAVLDDWILRAERLSSDFPLAPNGSMLVLERVAVAFPREVSDASDVFSRFTQRERDVLRLVLKGLWKNDISAALGIGIGSIRNIKLRLYRKSGVSSEGELVSKLVAFEGLL